jgi:hypothetical protein
VDWNEFMNISKDLTASIIRAMSKSAHSSAHGATAHGSHLAPLIFLDEFCRS